MPALLGGTVFPAVKLVTSVAPVTSSQEAADDSVDRAPRARSARRAAVSGHDASAAAVLCARAEKHRRWAVNVETALILDDIGDLLLVRLAQNRPLAILRELGQALEVGDDRRSRARCAVCERGDVDDDDAVPNGYPLLVRPDLTTRLDQLAQKRQERDAGERQANATNGADRELITKDREKVRGRRGDRPRLDRVQTRRERLGRRTGPHTCAPGGATVCGMLRSSTPGDSVNGKTGAKLELICCPPTVPMTWTIGSSWTV